MTKSAAILGVVNALMLALQSFGVPLNNAQQAVIGALVNAVLILVLAWRDPQVPFGQFPDDPDV